MFFFKLSPLLGTLRQSGTLLLVSESVRRLGSNILPFLVNLVLHSEDVLDRLECLPSIIKAFMSVQ